MNQDSQDYRDTLKLPKTKFPMRAGLPKREPEWLRRWQDLEIYDRLREKTGRKPFILHDGPPYANGNLHIGHALNKILKDLVVRSHQMMGFDASYIPGWDCHGLPIEWKIEERYRQRGKRKDDVPIVELRRECRKFAEEWIGIQREEFRRLGVIGNWDDPYLTMDFHAEAVIAEEFMKFLMNGTLYQGSKPVMWSIVEQTALAEAEVEYHDRKSDAIWVKFPVLRRSGATKADPTLERPVAAMIWTTTPWTIPNNRAICYNPDIDYAVYEVTDADDGNWAAKGDRLLIAERLADESMTAMRVLEYKKEQPVSSEFLSSLICAHPFKGLAGSGGCERNSWDFDVPLLPGDHVTDESGTGFVHTAPSHGVDDYQIGLAHGLPMTHNVLENGAFRDDLPFFGGKRIFTEKGKEGDANAAVINKLAEARMIVGRSRLTHSYPHSWRSKAPLIYRNTPQWFAAIDVPADDGMDELGATIRERALRSIDDCVAWTPATGRNRLHSMIENRPDWVLSRQRAWGVPLTCFVKKGTAPDDPDFLLRDERINRRIVEIFESEGADAWYVPGAKERFLGEHYEPDDYEQVFDILDVWFDSGTTHAFVLRDRPDGSDDGIADLYLEGTDQHRGWFHSSMLQACGTIGKAPYRGVLTHGFTLDENGIKMSKSLGNVVAPDQVVSQFGADILRLWVAQSDYTSDLRIGPEILKGVTENYRRLRNSFRFILGNLADYSESEAVAFSDMPELERWVLHRLAELDEQVRDGYAKFDFQGVFQELFNFATTDLSSFYFDIRKDVLYCDSVGSIERKSVRTVLDLLFGRLTLWLAPILSFTMEEVWLERSTVESASVHLLDFPQTPDDWLDESLAANWSKVRSVRKVVTSALEIQRRDKVIGSSLEASPTVFVESLEDKKLLECIDFHDICITSSITLKLGKAPEHAFRVPEIEGVAVLFDRAKGQKCRRCWKILPDVGEFSHPGLCRRCDTVVGSDYELASSQ